MKKLVNGKVIDVDNIELFELAAEGLALQNTATSNTSDGLDGTIDSLLVRKYIKQYDAFFKSMPYPLYAIEDDINRNFRCITIEDGLSQSSVYSIVQDTKGYIWIGTGDGLNVRSGPGQDYSIIDSLWDDDEVTILEETKGFYKISYQGKTGYASTAYIKVIEKGE